MDSQRYENSQNVLLGGRIKHRSGFNLPQSQSVATPSAHKHEIIIIPSTNTPAFGSMFICDIREKNCLIHNLTLQFNVSAISGITGAGTGYPNFNPAFCWFQRIEILQNATVIDTIYPEEQFILQQFFNRDEQRTFINEGAGIYSSNAQRATLASSTSNYYVNLKTYFDQCHIPLYTNASDIQLRIYMDSLTNQVNLGTGTGTAAASINSCNVIVKVSRMDQSTAANQVAMLQKSPFHYLFHDLRFGQFTVLNSSASTNLSTNIVMTPIVGRVALLYFVVRPTAAVTGNAQLQFTPITNFAILNNSSTNIVGGQVIPSSLALTYLNAFWSKSSYCTETALGTIDNKSNVYCWSFSSDPIRAIATGSLLGSYPFTGNEQLQLNFNSGTVTSNFTVSVFALTESSIEQGYGYVKKLSL